MYLLKFIKLPKEVKTLKILPLKKWIHLSEAELKYKEVVKNGSFSGIITLLIMNKETKQELQFEVLYEEGYSLADAINQDLIKEIRLTEDRKLRSDLEIIENEISLSFTEPLPTMESEEETKQTKFVDKLTKLIPFDKNKVEKNLGTPNLEENILDSPSKLQVNTDYQPDYEDGSVQDDIELLLQPTEEERENIKQEAAADNQKAKKYESELTYLPLDGYLAIERVEQLEELDRAISFVEKHLEMGSNYLLEELNLKNPDSFIENKRKEYIEKSYSKKYYENLLDSLREAKSNLLHTAVLSLSEKYANLTSENDPDKLDKGKSAIQNTVETKFKAELTQFTNEEAIQYKQLLERTKNRQIQELKQLEAKHAEEIAQMANEQTARIKNKESQLLESMNKEIDQEVKKYTYEFKKNQIIQANKELENFKIQQLENLRTVVVQTANNAKKKDMEYLDLMKENLLEAQPVFERQYEQFQEAQAKEKEEKRKEEELALKKRKVELEEKQVSLEEKTVNEAIDAARRMEKQNQDLQLQQQQHLVETMKMLQFPQQKSSEEQLDLQRQTPRKGEWWKGFLVATAAFVMIGGTGFVIHNYTVQRVNAIQHETARVLSRQTREMEQRLIELTETKQSEEEAAPVQTEPQAFEEYMVDQDYFSAAENYPNRREEIIEYLVAQGEKDELSDFVAKYPTENTLLNLKITLVTGTNEEILAKYQKNDMEALKSLSATQKEKMALVLYQAGCVEVANRLLEE